MVLVGRRSGSFCSAEADAEASPVGTCGSRGESGERRFPTDWGLGASVAEWAGWLTAAGLDTEVRGGGPLLRMETATVVFSDGTMVVTKGSNPGASTRIGTMSEEALVRNGVVETGAPSK